MPQTPRNSRVKRLFPFAVIHLCNECPKRELLISVHSINSFMFILGHLSFDHRITYIEYDIANYIIIVTFFPVSGGEFGEQQQFTCLSVFFVDFFGIESFNHGDLKRTVFSA